MWWFVSSDWKKDIYVGKQKTAYANDIGPSVMINANKLGLVKSCLYVMIKLHKKSF